MIKNNIRLLRENDKLTQEELAKKLNISRQTLISIEDSKTNISLKLAFAISNFFNKSIIDVFYESEDIDMGKKLNTIDDVKKVYGKNTIFIKDNLVYRCSTNKLEIGPKCLLSHKLPKYGKMKKFIILNDKIYSLVQTEDYKNRNDIVLHDIGEQVNIDINMIVFDETKAWNYK